MFNVITVHANAADVICYAEHDVNPLWLYTVAAQNINT